MSAVERFVAEHIEYHGLTDDRRAVVIRQLQALTLFAGVGLEDVTDRHLRDYLAAGLAAGLHVNTVRKHNHAIKPFFHWAWREGLIDADRWMRIKEVPNPRGATNKARPRPYKRKEIARFWRELDARFPLATPLVLQRWGRGTSPYRSVWRHAMHLQLRAVVGLALFGGLRRDEIFNAAIDDIHPDNDFIVVHHGKGIVGDGSGFREVPYTVEGREYVGEWLAFRVRMNPTDDRPWLVLDPRATPNSAIAPSAPNWPMQVDSFNQLLTRVGRGWGLHRLRHTCATEQLRAGMKLEKLSKFLGHADIEQTLCYAQIVREDVAREARRGESEFLRAVGRGSRLAA